MELKHCYLLLTIGVFISTFSAFFLLGDDFIHSLGVASLNTIAFLIILYYMIQSGRWRY